MDSFTSIITSTVIDDPKGPSETVSLLAAEQREVEESQSGILVDSEIGGGRGVFCTIV